LTPIAPLDDWNGQIGALPSNKPMKRTLNSGVESAAVPFGNNFFGLGHVSGAVERR